MRFFPRLTIFALGLFAGASVPSFADNIAFVLSDYDPSTVTEARQMARALRARGRAFSSSRHGWVIELNSVTERRVRHRSLTAAIDGYLARHRFARNDEVLISAHCHGSPTASSARWQSHGFCFDRNAADGVGISSEWLVALARRLHGYVMPGRSRENANIRLGMITSACGGGAVVEGLNRAHIAGACAVAGTAAVELYQPGPEFFSAVHSARTLGAMGSTLRLNWGSNGFHQLHNLSIRTGCSNRATALRSPFLRSLEVLNPHPQVAATGRFERFIHTGRTVNGSYDANAKIRALQSNLATLRGVLRNWTANRSRNYPLYTPPGGSPDVRDLDDTLTALTRGPLTARFRHTTDVFPGTALDPSQAIALPASFDDAFEAIRTSLGLQIHQLDEAIRNLQHLVGALNAYVNLDSGTPRPERSRYWTEIVRKRREYLVAFTQSMRELVRFTAISGVVDETDCRRSYRVVEELNATRACNTFRF